MGNRLSFYFSQGSKNLKNSVLIILGFSLALSMVSGINLYVDAYQKNLVTQSYENIIDFNIEYKSYDEKISDYFKNHDSSKVSLIQNSENLDIESHFRYFQLNTRDLTFYKNYSQLYGLDFHGYEIVDGHFANMGLFDEEFYTSKRFDEYFSIITGKTPKSEEEILIPVNLAYKFNLTLGETTNFNIKDAWNSEINATFSLSNVKIVGIYATKIQSYRIGFNYGLNHQYIYHSDNNSVSGFEELGDNYWASDFVFCYYNFSTDENNHPVQTLINNVNLFNKNLTSEDRYYSSHFSPAGVGFCFNRDKIDFNHLNSYSRKISQETQILARHFGSSSVYFQDYLSQHLSNLYEITTISRIVLQILNVPIIIFAILIGSFAIKTNAKSRLEELLLLKSKGSPNSLLRNQFFIEALFIGVASSTMALFAGFGTFYGFRESLGEILFDLNDSYVSLSPIISWGTVILTYCIGIGTTFIASFSSIAFVRKLPTYKLLSILGSDSLDIVYDEKSLFRKTEGKKLSVEETPFYENSQDQQKFVGKSKDSGLKVTKKIRKKHALFQNSVKTKEKKIPKISIALIIISLFPLILYLLYKIGSLPSALDIFISISDFIMRSFLVIYIFAIISPVLFVVGIIRILVIEKPSRFARISRFLSSIFLREKGFICGIEMVKRKQYKTIILLIGIFTSLLVFTNVFMNSFSRYDTIMDNILIGADAKVRYYNEEMSISNTSDIDLLESQLKSYKTSNNETLFNEVITCYSAWGAESYYGERYFLDIEKYLDIIQEGNKKLPTGDIASKIEDLIEYNKNSSNLIPGVIVNRGFLTLNNLTIGDLYQIVHRFYNSTSMIFENESFFVKIVVSIDVMPGFYITSGQLGSYEEKIIVDINSVKPDKDLLHGKDIFQMIDINIDVEDDPTALRFIMYNVPSGHVNIVNFQFYNQNWDDLIYELDISESGIYGMLYLEFTMIGILLAFGLAILIISFQKENKYFNGVLLARGFGRRGLLKLILSQISIIFIIGILSGLLSGFFTSFSFLQIAIVMNYGSGIISLPLFVNLLEIVEVLGIIVLSSFVIYLIAYYFEAKKNITEYFHKF